MTLTNVSFFILGALATCYAQALPTVPRETQTTSRAEISGTVLNGDSRPEPGVWIRAVGSEWQLYCTKANEKGLYKFSVYAPGKYIIVASPPDVSAFSQAPTGGQQRTTRECVTFYPSVLKRQDAEEIDVRPGQMRFGIDIRIGRETVPLVFLHGRVTGSRYSTELNETLSGGRLFDYSNPDVAYVFDVRRDGTFDVVVPTGSYAPLLVGNRGGGLRLTPDRIDVASSSRAKALAVQPMYRIRVHSIFEDGQQVRIPCCLTPQEFAQNSFASFTRVNVLKVPEVPFGPRDVYYYSENGDPAFMPAVPPGTYRVDAHWPIDATYLKTVRAGTHEYSPDAVQIDGRYRTLELVWSAKTAKVRVNLVETDLNAHGNWDLAIMSVPTPGRPLRKVAGTQFNSRQVSTFLLNVPPGRYLALLVNRVLGDNIWADTQFLSELFPFAVQFQADAEEQFNLAVPLIPAETLSVVMANAGFDPSGTRAVDFPR